MKKTCLQTKLNDKEKDLKENRGKFCHLAESMLWFWVWHFSQLITNIKHDILVGCATAGTHEYPDHACLKIARTSYDVW